jgi:aldehyde:ferredoxin oxidoreductase
MILKSAPSVPPGKDKVRFACISHDFGRQAGRTGVGAVLGLKDM